MEAKGLNSVSRLDPAAYLHLAGFRLVTVKPNDEDPGRAVFYFEEKEGFNEALTEYFSRRGQVEPIAYLKKLRDLKSLASEILSARRENIEA